MYFFFLSLQVVPCFLNSLTSSRGPINNSLRPLSIALLRSVFQDNPFLEKNITSISWANVPSNT